MKGGVKLLLPETEAVPRERLVRKLRPLFLELFARGLFLSTGGGPTPIDNKVPSHASRPPVGGSVSRFPVLGNLLDPASRN